MFKPLLALFAATAAMAPAAAAETASAGRWTLEVAPTGCVVHTSTPSGTVVSIFGIAGQESLSFLVQNKGWGSFADGAKYDIQVGFDGQRAWPMQAVARQNIDSDGPGLTFAVSPARDSGGGASFVEQFAVAQGMHIAKGGQRIETVSLADTSVAMQGLAKCLSQVWGGAQGEGEGGSVQLSADAKSI